MPWRAALVGIALALVAAPSLQAQVDWSTAGWSPAGEWRTLEVPGYRLHYPAPAEAWARHLAARLPAIRDRVEAEVGFGDARPVDVVLANPIAQPNGAAFPMLYGPRLVLLVEPPGASSQLGEFRDWPTLLVTHEQAHLSHLLRPSRQPAWRALGLPLGPIPLRAPRWAVEGFATLVEGRLSGSGRPAGAMRAAILRRLAQRGQLPGYGALSSTRGWLGGSLAYLGGSAFLDWLTQREGDASLDQLWRRLTARRGRSFDEAFRGVYGDTPAALWGRFAAELTWKSVEAEHRLAPALREGEPWLDRRDATGAPALSQDGARLVVALGSRKAPLRLAVYSTAEDADAAAREARERERLLARDPEDVAAVRRGAPPRQPLASLELPGTTVAPLPRFLRDGSLLFARSLPDHEGRWRADLFRWWPGTRQAPAHKVRRLTTRADLRAADPAPDGTWAVAVESRWGATRLVRVDLGDGSVTPITEASVDTVVDAPRVAPDGARVAYLRHPAEASGWELVVRELASGSESVVPTPPGFEVFDPAWDPRGDALYAVVGESGLLDVQRLPLGAGAAAGARTQVTRLPGAALAPAPTPDGTALYFLALEPEGLPVRRIALADAPTAGPTLIEASELYPALPPPPALPPAPLALAAVPESRPYGAGRGEWSLLSGGTAAPAAGSLELGARGGDLVGRWDLLAVGALGTGAGARGGALAAAWRGLPVELGVHAFDAQEHLRPDMAPGRGALEGDLDERGIELAAAWRRPWLGGGLALRLAGGGGSRRIDDPILAEEATATRPTDDRQSTGSLLLDTSVMQEVRRGTLRANGALALALQEGRTAGASWDRIGGRIDAGVSMGALGLAVAAERRDDGGDPAAADRIRVGGLPSTLSPALLTAGRIYEPGLPAGALTGTAYEGERVDVDLRGLPLQPFWVRHRVELVDGWSDWLSLAGLDFTMRLPPLALVRLPALDLRLGAAYVLDEPYRGDVRGWVALTYRP